jgi:hypothetical protein
MIRSKKCTTDQFPNYKVKILRNIVKNNHSMHVSILAYYSFTWKDGLFVELDILLLRPVNKMATLLDWKWISTKAVE